MERAAKPDWPVGAGLASVEEAEAAEPVSVPDPHTTEHAGQPLLDLEAVTRPSSTLKSMLALFDVATGLAVDPCTIDQPHRKGGRD